MTEVSTTALAIGMTAAAAAATGKIQCYAKAHGTFNSPHDSRIIYVDPGRDEPEIHSPLLTRAEAKVAYERGLIEDPENADRVAEAEAARVQQDPNAIGPKSAERTEEFAEQDDEGGPGSGSLDSRSSTAWQDRERVEGDVQGYADGARTSDAGTAAPAPAIDTESGDDDAPPAPKPAAKAKPKPATT